MLIKSL